MNELDKPSELSEFPVIVSLPVLWGDQDSFGHVNNVVHIRWFESGRVAYMAQAGFPIVRPEAGGYGPILASITCHYRRQLSFPDTVLVGSRVTRFGRTSMTVEHAVYSQSLAALAADGQSIVVMFDYAAGKSIPVPAEVRAAIERLENKSY
jgi:acyl-CoA thioester hydrolase